MITPRGVEKTTADDFTQVTVYDELNRVKEVIYPHAPTSSKPLNTEVNKLICDYRCQW